MKVAIVHDYIKEFGGAERVLKTLTEIYPNAPIYTAFRVKGSIADIELGKRKVIESFLAPLLKLGKLYSPLRFLIPVIWGSFDLSKFDLVITSCSWYVTRGFKVGPKTKVVAYCHTPPRWLYGYQTSVDFTRYWPIKIYSAIVGHFIRMYDFNTAQKINNWIANSNNVKERIWKFYRKKATVIYPPIEIPNLIETKDKNKDYYLIASRLVGAKGIEEAIQIFTKLGKNLKIVGESHGYSNVITKVRENTASNIEFLGRPTDEVLYKLYAGAKAFIALAKDEDFGMTVVEAQGQGTPVIAFNGGGFKESIINGKTGILINEVSEKEISKAILQIENIKWNRDEIIDNAKRFSKERFIKEMLQFINEKVKEK